MLITWKRTKKLTLDICISEYRARYSSHGISIESLIFWNESFYRWQEQQEQLHHQTKMDLIAFLYKVPSINCGKKIEYYRMFAADVCAFCLPKSSFHSVWWSFFLGFVVKYFIKCFSAFRVLNSKNSFSFFLAVRFKFIFPFLQSFLCFSVYSEKSA